jgi:hypothetical protein
MNYMTQFFAASADARELFKQPRTQEIYSKGFVDAMNNIIAGINKSAPDWPTDSVPFAVSPPATCDY